MKAAYRTFIHSKKTNASGSHGCLKFLRSDIWSACHLGRSNVLSKATIFLTCTTLLTLFLATGCSRVLFNEEEAADDAANTILQAIEENDLSILAPMLAPCAAKAADLQEGLAYAHSLLDGPIISVECFDTSYGSATRGPRRSKSILGGYNIATENQEYKLCFEYYPCNTIDDSKEGICCVYFETQETYQGSSKAPDGLWHYGAPYERPGIYYPRWQVPQDKFASEAAS